MRSIVPALLLVTSAGAPLGAQTASGAASAAATRDTAFRSMQERGRGAMGVDQYTSVHRFDALPTGGRIELRRGVDDSAGVARIRAHIREIAAAFTSGDFSTPAFVHMQQVPGTKVMRERRDRIAYEARDVPGGAELLIRTSDPAALEAVHSFMAFQRGEHHAGGMGGMTHSP